jgi:ABC-type transport system involved in multi-copper enzyme maturation permease subunit
MVVSTSSEREGMFSILVVKELRLILRSPKFAAAFGLSTLLLLVSVFTGILEYRAATAQFALGNELSQQTLRAQASWMGVSVNAYRAPDPLQILCGGITNSIGRFSPISTMAPARLRHSAYTDEPLYAVFGPIDPAFVVVVVFSLMAIVFSYDAVNGEREAGTLRLAFANAIPRRLFIAAKFTGSWLALILPLLLPVLVITAVLLLSGIPFTTTHWMRYALFWGLSFLVMTFFLALGLCASAVVRRSSSSFLIALACWVGFVFLLPRLAVLAAAEIRPAPSAAEVDAQQDIFARDRMEENMRSLQQRWQKRSQEMAARSEDEAMRYRKEKNAQWTSEDEADRLRVQQEVDQHALLLQQDRDNVLAAQQELAVNLARCSPASDYLFAAMLLAGTDPGLKTRTMESLRRYRETVNAFVAARQKETGTSDGFRVSFDSRSGFSFSIPRERGTLDLAGFPAYNASVGGVYGPFLPLVVNTGILILAILLAYSGAVAAFHRFDLR